MVTDRFLPDDTRELVLRLGKVEWCGVEQSTPEELGVLFQKMIENTDVTHGTIDNTPPCHYVATGNLSIAMVGTSPNSGLIAQLITALWNYAHERCLLEEVYD